MDRIPFGKIEMVARNHSGYSWKALFKTVPKSPDAVSDRLVLKQDQKTQRILKAYHGGIGYGTEQLTKTVYKTHRRISIAQELQEDE